MPSREEMPMAGDRAPIAAQTARDTVQKFRTGIGATEEALARVEASMHAVESIGALMRSNKLLGRALKAWKRGNAPRTAQLALEAANADTDNAQAYHLLAIALEKLGHLDKALVTYEKAFELAPDDADLLLNLGLSAWNLGMLEGAVRMFRHFIEKRPGQPQGYNNLGSVLRDQGKLSTAIELLRDAIYRMPNEAMLWNTLATVLAEEGRAEESLVFYTEALRLDPKLARVWHNLGYAYSHLGKLEDALHAYDSALALSSFGLEEIETKHSRSICQIGLGQIEEGFKGYEIRHAPQFRAWQLHYTKAPLWAGEDLNGKRILLVGEQGLGDEIMFANIVPDIAHALGAQGQLQIAVDARLIPIFQRSFPNAEIGSYDNGKLDGKSVRVFQWARKEHEPDFYAPMGTPLHILRRRLEDFPRVAFLKADAEKTAAYRARLQELGSGPYVGVCWRSMVLGQKRRKYFSAIDTWGPILKTPGVTFVNLQYGQVDEELKLAQEKLGVTIHRLNDINLKDDLDSAAALTAACDLVVAAPTAAAAMAGALGKEVWFLTASRVWPQLGTDHYPWYRSSKVFSCEAFADWGALMPKVAAALAAFAKSSSEK
jgi:tetratricopeptide (TPR) repeat protein